MQKKWVISACLLGVCCRYDGESCKDDDLFELFCRGDALPVCPEVLGGLNTPRKPAEILKEGDEDRRVMTCDGEDVTEEFLKGARAALTMARIFGAESAVLKSSSPSCGSRFVYDGTFSGKLICGEGVTAELFRKKGMEVFNEKEWNVYFNQRSDDLGSGN